jgi:hypothetical protein
MRSLLSDLSVPRSNRKKIPEINRKMLHAWLRCNLCCGTGYIFSPSRLSINAKMGVTVATMTSDRCEVCLGRGFVQYLDA